MGTMEMGTEMVMEMMMGLGLGMDSSSYDCTALMVGVIAAHI